MKKFIKKTIAGLIAGVMAISSMPFTALAADSYNAKPATSFNAKTGTATVYWDQSSDKSCTGYYNNLLYFNRYSEKIDGTPTANTDKNYCQTGAYYPTMVFLYDGVTDAYAPVMGKAQKSDFFNTARYLNYFVPMDNNDSNNLADSSNFYCDTWIGSKGGTLDYTWTLGQSHHGVRASISDNSSSVFGLTKNTYYPHSSKLHVSKTVNFEGDSGYSHAQQIWWFAGSHTDSGKAPASGDKNFGQANKTTYVVNYKPLYNAATEAAEQLKTFDETKYTVASVNAYYTAINAMYNFDPNSYFANISEADVATQVGECAKAIKARVDGYTNAKKNLEKLPQIEQSYIDSYNNALAEANAKVSEADKYTAESIDALQKVIADVKAKRDGVKTNEELDKLTTSLLTAISNLVQTKFTVKFVKIKDGNPVEEPETTVNYGDPFQANAGANVKGWVVYTNGNKTKTRLNTLDREVSVVITEDTKIEAYLSGEEATENSSKVTFLGRHNQVIAIKYVAENQNLEEEINKVSAPKIPFYDFVKWDVSKTDDGKEYTVKAIYKCTQAEDNKCIVHFNGKDKAYTYNSYVYLFGADKSKKYALYDENDKLLVALDGVDFYTPQRKHIYVKEYTGTEEANVAVMGSFGTKEVSETGTKYVANFNCKFNIPANAEAVDWGVILENNKGVQRPISIKEKSERNEYTVRIKVSQKVEVKACAYVTYKTSDGTPVTKKSGFVTVDLNTL